MQSMIKAHGGTKMLEAWTRTVLRFRFLVLACWLAVAVLGGISATQLPGLLSNSLTVPGTSSEQANSTLALHFGENPEGTFTVVALAGGTAAKAKQLLARRLAAAAKDVPGSRATTVTVQDGLAYGDIVTGLDLQRAETYTDPLRKALARTAHPAAYVTGPPAIQHDLDPILAADLRKGELVAVPVALLLLALVLGLRAVFLLPLVFAASTITAALGVVYLVAHVVTMVSYVPNLVELMGLGLAIDYSLLCVQRFREEAGNQDVRIDDAIVRTMATAGRSVLFSGLAVAVGLCTVLLIPVPFIRSLGTAGVIVPAVSTVAALTVQPALLSLFGRQTLLGKRVVASGGSARPRQIWRRLARTVIQRPVAVLCASAAVLVVMGAPVLWLQLTPGSLDTIPRFTESGKGLTLLRERVGSGTITPIEIVLDSGFRDKARSGTLSAATLRLATTLLRDPEVFVVAIGSRQPYIDDSGRYRRMLAIGRHSFGDEATLRLVQRVRQDYVPAAKFPRDVRTSVGGVPAEGEDFLSRVYGAFPWIVAAALLLAYVVLLHAFRSLLLPLVALALDVVSVSAAYGLLVVTFRFGAGARLLGLYQTPQIEGWVPVLLFATLFGLSMDYQVFLVSRMREAWDRSQDHPAAIAEGLERTGRIVSAAAVIMVVCFSGFVTGRVAGLQEFGAGLVLGVLLDATVVRLMLMPSLIVLLDRWSWWLPAGIARIAGVQASPLADRKRRPVERLTALTSRR